MNKALSITTLFLSLPLGCVLDPQQSDDFTGDDEASTTQASGGPEGSANASDSRSAANSDPTTCHLDDCAFDIALLPINVPPGGGVGELDFDGSCNLIVAGGTDNIVHRIDPVGMASPLGIVPNVSSVLGIAYRWSDDLIYVSTDVPAQLWSVTPTGESSFIMDLPSTFNAIEVAPAGFGAYGDMIVGASHDGTIYAVDPIAGSIGCVGNAGTIISDLVFDPIVGTLYLADYYGGDILTMDAAGIVDYFAFGLDEPDGLAIDPANTLFVAAPSVPFAGSVTAIDIATGMQSVIAEPFFSIGHYVTGLRLDANGNLLMKTLGGTIDYAVP